MGEPGPKNVLRQREIYVGVYVVVVQTYPTKAGDDQGRQHPHPGMAVKTGEINSEATDVRRIRHSPDDFIFLGTAVSASDAKGDFGEASGMIQQLYEFRI